MDTEGLKARLTFRETDGQEESEIFLFSGSNAMDLVGLLRSRAQKLASKPRNA
jgi:hypothetical protein